MGSRGLYASDIRGAHLDSLPRAMAVEDQRKQPELLMNNKRASESVQRACRSRSPVNNELK
eukprot:SAG31_NODE_2777_length_5104_cov_3.012587_2_plen_61_part_00